MQIIYILDSYVGQVFLNDEKEGENIILIIIRTKMQRSCQVYNFSLAKSV